MKRSEMVKLIAEQLFYRDMARERQFYFREEDRPFLADASDEELYYRDATSILNKIEDAGLKPPHTKHCSVLLTHTHVWQKEEENESK